MINILQPIVGGDLTATRQKVVNHGPYPIYIGMPNQKVMEIFAKPWKILDPGEWAITEKTVIIVSKNGNSRVDITDHKFSVVR